VLLVLESFGLNHVEAEVYIYLARKGPKPREDIARVMKLPGIRSHQVLESLKKKGFIYISNETCEIFAALNFSEAIDMMIAIKDEETKIMRETKRELLSSWLAINQRKKQDTT
jgi:sugar-specific transcriptional regulator TrmB